MSRRDSDTLLEIQTFTGRRQAKQTDSRVRSVATTKLPIHMAMQVITSGGKSGSALGRFAGRACGGSVATKKMIAMNINAKLHEHTRHKPLDK